MPQNIVNVTVYGYPVPGSGVLTMDIGLGYVLVPVGDKIQAGDEVYSQYMNSWSPCTNTVGMLIGTGYPLVRRKSWKIIGGATPVGGSVSTPKVETRTCSVCGKNADCGVPCWWCSSSG
jgi:hypothetical protein